VATGVKLSRKRWACRWQVQAGRTASGSSTNFITTATARARCATTLPTRSRPCSNRYWRDASPWLRDDSSPGSRTAERDGANPSDPLNLIRLAPARVPIEVFLRWEPVREWTAQTVRGTVEPAIPLWLEGGGAFTAR